MSLSRGKQLDLMQRQRDEESTMSSETGSEFSITNPDGIHFDYYEPPDYEKTFVATGKGHCDPGSYHEWNKTFAPETTMSESNRAILETLSTLVKIILMPESTEETKKGSLLGITSLMSSIANPAFIPLGMYKPGFIKSLEKAILDSVRESNFEKLDKLMALLTHLTSNANSYQKGILKEELRGSVKQFSDLLAIGIKSRQILTNLDL